MKSQCTLYRKGCPLGGQQVAIMKMSQTPEKGTEGVNTDVKPFVEEEIPEKGKPISPPSGGWGDSEHDTRLHKNLKPHSAPPNYDPEWGRYRHEE